MNILYITNHLNIGGVTSYVLSLAKGLKERGHNIYIASSQGQLLPKLKEEGLTYIRIPIDTKKEISPKILASRFKLVGILKKLDIDIIHSNSRTTQVLGCLVAGALGIPHIYTCHGFFKKRILRRIFPCWGAKVVAISEQVKEHLQKDFGLEERSICMVHNGIDMKRFRKQGAEDRRQAKLELGLSDGPVAGIVARLSDVKGHAYLIEAMSEVLKKIPAAQLLIVGEGREKENLAKQVKELDMLNSVFFFPQTGDTPKVLYAMDLFVMPSLQEGLGLALMEAMACGLAVIGSDVGGIRSLIRDNSNGRLVKPADSHGLACTIIELLENNQKRESLGQEARIFIGEKFSLEKTLLATERIYQECLNAKY